MMGVAPISDFEDCPPPSAIDAVRAEHLGTAIARLQAVQAMAGAYAAMLVGQAYTRDDLTNFDRLFTNAVHMTGEALASFDASLFCEGVA